MGANQHQVAAQPVLKKEQMLHSILCHQCTVNAILLLVKGIVGLIYYLLN